MKKQDYILIGILAIAVIGLAFTAFNFFGSGQAVQVNTADSGAVKSQSLTKTSDGEVTIDITPKSFKNGNMYFLWNKI